MKDHSFPDDFGGGHVSSMTFQQVESCKELKWYRSRVLSSVTGSRGSSYWLKFACYLSEEVFKTIPAGVAEIEKYVLEFMKDHVITMQQALEMRKVEDVFLVSRNDYVQEWTEEIAKNRPWVERERTCTLKQRAIALDQNKVALDQNNMVCLGFGEDHQSSVTLKAQVFQHHEAYLRESHNFDTGAAARNAAHAAAREAVASFNLYWWVNSEEDLQLKAEVLQYHEAYKLALSNFDTKTTRNKRKCRTLERNVSVTWNAYQCASAKLKGKVDFEASQKKSKKKSNTHSTVEELPRGQSMGQSRCIIMGR